MKRIVIAAVVLASLCGAAVAQAAVVNEFSFALKDVKPSGSYTVVFNSRSYDTNGAVPPVLMRNYIRIPAGAKIRPEVIKGNKALCNVPELKRSKLPDTCKGSKIGNGTAKVDARNVINPLTGQPYLQELIPYNLNFYLAKPQVAGAVASFVILALPDTNSSFVNSIPIIRDTKVVLVANFFNDPTPDGRFGYRFEIPAGPVSGFRISVAEVHAINPGYSITKKKKVCKTKRKGRCIKKKVKKTKIFWFTEPPCPPSKTLPFQSYYEYENNLEPAKTIEVTIPCPSFKH
ncbi:MAG: hypothetical protein WDZ37_04730 [Solirubrobacterales bacterium]